MSLSQVSSISPYILASESMFFLWLGSNETEAELAAASARRRVLVRLLTEMQLVGLFKDDELVSKVIRSLVRSQCLLIQHHTQL